MLLLPQWLTVLVPMVVTAATDTPSSSNETGAVRGLLGRLLPLHVAQQIELEQQPLSPLEIAAGLTDFFELQSPARTSPSGGEVVVQIRGSSGVAIASGLRHYLWHYANTSFSWWGDNLQNLPRAGESLPSVPGLIRRSTTLKYRMAINSCAFGYTTPYWNFTRWVREIDLMALRGVNVVNQHEGGAWVYQQVFMQLGLNRSELPFPGVSHGQGYGIFEGPRPQAFIESHLKLQQAVVAQMATFGMAPLLQVWGGNVPDTFADHYPNAKILARPGTVPGGAMPGGIVGDVLHPDDPMYGDIGSLFVKVARKAFGGLGHFYDGGTWFDEANTQFLNVSYVQSVARASYDAMAAADPDAVWIDSAWRFGATPSFWESNGGAAMKAYLTAFPYGRHVSRNIAADKEGASFCPNLMNSSAPCRNNTNLWNASSSFFNTSWIYGQVQNFGGRPGIYGRLDSAAYDFPKVRKTPSWPRSWANSSLLYQYSHRNAWANLHFLGQPDIFLAQVTRHDIGYHGARPDIPGGADAAGQEFFATNRSLADSYFPTYGAFQPPAVKSFSRSPVHFLQRVAKKIENTQGAA
jgi:alpha-N-acetylglucosaminidase